MTSHDEREHLIGFLGRLLDAGLTPRELGIFAIDVAPAGYATVLPNPPTVEQVADVILTGEVSDV